MSTGSVGLPAVKATRARAAATARRFRWTLVLVAAAGAAWLLSIDRSDPFDACGLRRLWSLDGAGVVARVDGEPGGVVAAVGDWRAAKLDHAVFDWDDGRRLHTLPQVLSSATVRPSSQSGGF